MSGVPLVVGVDSSTQSTKVEARELASGRLVASGRAGHPAVTPPLSEQSPDAWWDALVVAFEQLGGHRDDVVSMSIAGQQHGLVLVDDLGRVVRPAKLWNDTTSAPDAARLVADHGASWWSQACGSVPVAAFTVSKLAWMALHETAALERTSQVMLPHDHLTWRATGEHVTDRGDASGTGWFDPVTNTYLAPQLAAAAAGIGVDQLPRVAGVGEAIGTLTDDAAGALGLGPGVVVGPGTGDNMAAALGLGLEPGDAVISLGTSGTVYATSATATNDSSGAVAGFADAAGRFLPLVCTLNATRVTDTMATLMGMDRDQFAAMSLAADPSESGPTMLPYLDGERTPNLPEARGALFGLQNSTTREALARAAHDGVICGLLDGLDALVACGVSVDGRLFLVGGGARSAAYRQRCADLSGRSVIVPEADETVATGAAVQAAAVFDERSSAEVARDWGCGAGSSVEPVNDDGPDVRARFAHHRQSAEYLGDVDR
jgi:xylulokinase